MTSAFTLVQEMEQMLDQGLWEAGERIPTERSLSERFGAARNTVRRALLLLEEKNRVLRRVGLGTFVSTRGDATVPVQPSNTFEAGSGALLASLVDSSPADVMEVRIIVEPAVSALAATRATKSQLEHLAHVVECGRKARSEEYEHYDALFHLGIFEAVRNPLLTGLCRCMNEIRRQSEWLNIKRLTVTPERRALYDKSHRDILNALRLRDGPEARRLMTHHLTAVRSYLLDPGLF